MRGRNAGCAESKPAKNSRQAGSGSAAAAEGREPPRQQQAGYSLQSLHPAGNAGAAAAFCQEIFGDVTTLYSLTGKAVSIPQ